MVSPSSRTSATSKSGQLAPVLDDEVRAVVRACLRVAGDVEVGDRPPELDQVVGEAEGVVDAVVPDPERRVEALRRQPGAQQRVGAIQHGVADLGPIVPAAELGKPALEVLACGPRLDLIRIAGRHALHQGEQRLAAGPSQQLERPPWLATLAWTSLCQSRFFRPSVAASCLRKLAVCRKWLAEPSPRRALALLLVGARGHEHLIAEVVAGARRKEGCGRPGRGCPKQSVTRA